MNKSFTLIEILVVIVVIGILSAFILVGMSSITSSANIAKVQAFINSMDNALLLGRVSQWKFDELTTAKEAQPIRDSWGSNNGTLYTGSDGLEKISSNCPSGNCLSFDGSNDYVNISSSSSLTIANTFTISTWINTTNKNTHQCIWNNTEYAFEIGDNVAGAGGIAQIGMVRLGIGHAGITNNNVITIGWHHIVYTKNGTGATNKIYLDGIDLTLLANVSFNWSSSGTNYIGFRGASLYPFNGSIDDVRIYNQAIPTSEIQQNYFVGLNNLYKNNGITLNEFNQRIGELKTNLVKNE